jgi:hypothetical protein
LRASKATNAVKLLAVQGIQAEKCLMAQAVRAAMRALEATFWSQREFAEITKWKYAR